jgi:hypothetical protein
LLKLLEKEVPKEGSPRTCNIREFAMSGHAPGQFARRDRPRKTAELGPKAQRAWIAHLKKAGCVLGAPFMDRLWGPFKVVFDQSFGDVNSPIKKIKEGNAEQK